tara:strand:+ start:309 stop:575 length:267 start_codon:yes stop_codon:yes gene_type:complete
MVRVRGIVDTLNLTVPLITNRINKQGDNMSITGMLAVGNGEPCPFCTKEPDRKVEDIFISQPYNDLIGHMMEEHPEELDKQLSGGNYE